VEGHYSPLDARTSAKSSTWVSSFEVLEVERRRITKVMRAAAQGRHCTCRAMKAGSFRSSVVPTPASPRPEPHRRPARSSPTSRRLARVVGVETSAFASGSYGGR
jgi:hypothetical protein